MEPLFVNKTKNHQLIIIQVSADVRDLHASSRSPGFSHGHIGLGAKGGADNLFTDWTIRWAPSYENGDRSNLQKKNGLGSGGCCVVAGMAGRMGARGRADNLFNNWTFGRAPASLGLFMAS